MERKKSNRIIIEVTLVEPLLGTTPGNPQLATDYQAAKHPEGPQPDEVEVIEDRVIEQEKADEKTKEELKKLSTVFPRLKEDDSIEGGRPFIWDYQLKGHLKGASEALIFSDQYTKEALKKIRVTPYLYKKTIDTQVFVFPRRIPILGDYVVETLERPLRAQTMKGERISLARSELIPAGATFTAEIIYNNSNLEDWIQDCLDYAKLGGFMQWRNSGMGRFTWEDITPERLPQLDAIELAKKAVQTIETKVKE